MARGGRDDRQQRPLPGARIPSGDRSHRIDRHETRRQRQGRHRNCDPGRAWSAHSIRRHRRKTRRPGPIRRPRFYREHAVAKVSNATEQPAEEITPPVPVRGLASFISKFTVLKGAQRELWLTFLIKFLIYTAYSVTNKTMVLWLSNDLGFSDQAAGALVGWFWAPAMTVFTLLAGCLTAVILL